MTPLERTLCVKRVAARLGLDRCGIARAEPIGRAAYLRAWLDAGRAGSMEYLNRYFTQRTDPRELLPNATSVIVVALLYHQPHPPGISEDGSARGRVAMYAWGDDYHDIIKAKLRDVMDHLRAELSEPFEFKVCVDTSPLLERELAAAAGIGWIGKNTLVLNQKVGSYFFLGEIVTTLEIAPDEPMADHCGTCTRCLDACPTQAFPQPYEMDASRCISYLTIERRQPIRDDLHASMEDWIFGCDVCQQVCPYNQGAPLTQEPSFKARPPSLRPVLEEVIAWSADDYRQQLQGSAMKRATLPMLQRNARIALANARE
ncbi:MAG: tRNA epoxyqueuosine(34) reductase QueG [Planctomycetes bacterium]|nr:tRNA epoxyqueuosine(34) reductase QueG [Planctomycetota bacterium]